MDLSLLLASYCVLICSVIIQPSTQRIRYKINQNYCINIRLLNTFTTYFDPTGSSSGNFHEIYRMQTNKLYNHATKQYITTAQHLQHAKF
jgi:hypothetical protein